MDFFAIFFERFKEFFERLIKLFSFVSNDYFTPEGESTTGSGFIAFDKIYDKKPEKF